MLEIVIDNSIGVFIVFATCTYLYVCSMADSNCSVKICCMILDILECVLLKK